MNEVYDFYEQYIRCKIKFGRKLCPVCLYSNTIDDQISHSENELHVTPTYRLSYKLHKF